MIKPSSIRDLGDATSAILSYLDYRDYDSLHELVATIRVHYDYDETLLRVATLQLMSEGKVKRGLSCRLSLVRNG